MMLQIYKEIVLASIGKNSFYFGLKTMASFKGIHINKPRPNPNWVSIILVLFCGVCLSLFKFGLICNELKHILVFVEWVMPKLIFGYKPELVWPNKLEPIKMWKMYFWSFIYVNNVDTKISYRKIIL